MADIIDTLHPKTNLDDNLYPNIKKENIPNGSIDTSKLADNSVTSSKLAEKDMQTLVNTWLDSHPEATTTVEDGAVTTSKIANTAVTPEKLNISSVYNMADLKINNVSLMSQLGIGRWAGQRFYRPYTTTNTYTLFDDLSTSYTSLIRCFSKISLCDNYSGKIINNTTIICPDLPTIHDNNAASFMFSWWEENSNMTLMLGNGSLGGQYMFGHSPAFSKIDVQEGKTFQITNYSQGIFSGCTNLEYIGPIDMSLAEQNNGGNAFMFQHCTKLKTIKITHWKASFDISSSTAFEEDALIEILNNLDTVTTEQTLIMGTINLNKLIDLEGQYALQTAKNKGWKIV